MLLLRVSVGFWGESFRFSEVKKDRGPWILASCSLAFCLNMLFYKALRAKRVCKACFPPAGKESPVMG